MSGGMFNSPGWVRQTKRMEAPMPTDDWVRERAVSVTTALIWDDADCDCETCITARAVVATALQEAIDRTSSEERALAAEALKRANARTAVQARAGFNDGRRSIIDRLRNPDQALVDSVSEYGGIGQGGAWATRLLRAIAATLDEKGAASE